MTEEVEQAFCNKCLNALLIKVKEKNGLYLRWTARTKDKTRYFYPGIPLVSRVSAGFVLGMVRG